MPFGLKDIEINRLKQLFAADGHIETVILYGSRAKGTYKPFSDVDITLTMISLMRILSDCPWQ